MANTIQLRRSATANAVPTTAQLALGELAINTTDGKLYLKKNVSGVETIVDVTGGGASISVSDTAPASPGNGSLWWNSNIGVLKIYYNDGTSSQWVDASHTSSAPSGGTVSYPQNIQSGNYTLVLDDAGKHIYSANTGAQTITIPTNASVAFPIGTAITIVNEGTTQIALSVAGVTVRNNASSVALAAPIISPAGAVQLLKVGTNTWKATFGVMLNNVTIQYLIIAGGGSGGGGPQGGGGGAGGYLTGSVTANGSIVVTVGAGGASGTGTGNNGVNSSITGVTAAVGGGAGGRNGLAGSSGGSGGGAGSNYPNANLAGGSGTAGQGNAGGTTTDSANYYQSGGGGGGGAVGGNGSGTTAGVGGNGLASSITGTSVTRAGGGGGGNIYGAQGAGGTGGGGAGGNPGTSGTANTGSGGGGATNGGNTFGAGGSGVVILSVPTVEYSGVTTGSPTVTTSGSNTILTFNSSGSYTA
jgi:hypothetical protein